MLPIVGKVLFPPLFLPDSLHLLVQSQTMWREGPNLRQSHYIDGVSCRCLWHLFLKAHKYGDSTAAYSTALSSPL